MTNNQEYIDKAITVHGNKYNYDKIDWTDRRCLLIIICPIHGEFIQREHTHLKGSGCPSCGKVKAMMTRLKGRTNEEFINEARAIHGNLYDY